MFLGRFVHTIDSKGRVSVPVKFREILSQHHEDILIVAAELGDHCLVAYPKEEWSVVEEKTKSLPMMRQEVKDWMRFFYSSATDCGVDRQGRILIPPNLRDYAKLGKEVVLIGMLNKFEIWDSKRWKEKESQMPKHFEKISEALAGLGL